MIPILCTAEDHGHRLDTVLAKKSSVSRTTIQQAIHQAGVTLQSDPTVTLTPRTRVLEGQIFHLSLPAALSQRTLTPHPMPLDIVFEDPYILVLNKPTGCVVHPGIKTPQPTLVEGVLHHTSLPPGDHPLRPGIVHRLDQGTSGLMMITKTPEAYTYYAQAFRQHTLIRRYTAFVHGCPIPPSYRIHTLIRRNPKYPLKRQAVALDTPGVGKEAITLYQCQTFYKTSKIARLTCRLHTGRTHQIRAHMAWVGHPLVADPLYHPQGQGHPLLSRPALHSDALEFFHPFAQKTLSFTLPLPQDLQDFSAQLT